ncbi:lysophospholipid acyltransferase family protein [Chamaesiphon polymorphus]|uniref:1-acyl-sn-glycerol-3-phosphate acyltransferase n=1 Tax=Chamaesiphon polymorphus CCALA 037 TaxID=2107692 RepID=A0A2T1GBZ5_9CYAN|nr:1-acyl-sn-glycerol-3-phosphate acyltransferase [Chamaesiphon polymorphus]PSB54854.1 1-acyl-sn-glycerol-3-phosphate acyltransferase [Chamaesiphon polymorphus CCALA 037]
MTDSPLATTTPKDLSSSVDGHQTRVSPWLKKIIYPLGQYLVLPSYFREIEIIGQENIPKTGAVILAPTHRTRWDAILVPYACGPYVTGRDLRFMVSIDEMKGIQGWFASRLGGFAIDTTKPGIASIRNSVELLHAGEMLTIFPEGNIFRDGTLHPLKKGLSRIAMQAEALKPGLNLKIIPIDLNYEHPVVRFRDRVSIQIGTPIEVQNYQQFSTKTGAEKIHQDLTQALTNLMQQSQPDSV